MAGVKFGIEIGMRIMVKIEIEIEMEIKVEARHAFALSLTELENSPCGPEGFELEFCCEELG
jgi:hypothetical protein